MAESYDHSQYVIGAGQQPEQTAGDLAGVAIGIPKAVEGKEPKHAERGLLANEALAERVGSEALAGTVITPANAEKAPDQPDPSASLGVIGGGQSIPHKPIERQPEQPAVPGLVIGNPHKQ